MRLLKKIGNQFQRSLLRGQGALSPAPVRVPELDLSDCEITFPSKYRWHSTAKWLDPILLGLSYFQSSGLQLKRTADLQQPPAGDQGEHVVRCEFRRGQKRIRFAIDYSDYAPIDHHTRTEVDLYFKFQFQRSGYNLEARGNTGAVEARVVPGGFVVGDPLLYRTRHLLRQNPTEPHFVLGRFGAAFGQGVRANALRILTTDSRVPFRGGLALNGYYSYLREVSGAAAVVDLPGNGVFCFRLVEYLALGGAIIAFPHQADLPEPLVDGKHLLYTREDFSDAGELALRILEDSELRQGLKRNAAEYFDNHLSPERLAAGYLRELLALV